jgi:hypothetical protein
MYKAEHFPLNSTDSINDIAYTLGLNYPYCFEHLFKQKNTTKNRTIKLTQKEAKSLPIFVSAICV